MNLSSLFNKKIIFKFTGICQVLENKYKYNYLSNYTVCASKLFVIQTTFYIYILLLCYNNKHQTASNF